MSAIRFGRSKRPSTLIGATHGDTSMLATVCAENLLPDKVYDEEYSPISGRPRRALSVQQSRESLSSGIWSGANPLPDTLSTSRRD